MNLSLAPENERISQNLRSRLERDVSEVVRLDDEDATELMLIRHAETQTCGAICDESNRGARLSRSGVEQARRLALRLRPLWVEQVYFAPEQATEETATIISDIIRRPAACIPDLRDISFAGPLRLSDGDTDTTIQERFVANPRWDSVPGFEGSRTFRLRVVLSLESLLARHPGRRVVVVTHGSLINAYLSMVLDIPRDYFFDPEHASVSTVRSFNDLYAVRAINDTAHLQRI